VNIECKALFAVVSFLQLLRFVKLACGILILVSCL